VASEDKEAFKTLPSERAVTPQAVLLDPRSDMDTVDQPEERQDAA
jgi:hypothetical protein